MFGINILGTGSYTPRIKVTNDDLSKIVETNDEWISTRTGMKSRYLTDGESCWEMGANAAKKAVEAAGIDPERIGLVIGTTVTPDFYTPSLASLVQDAVGPARVLPTPLTRQEDIFRRTKTSNMCLLYRRRYFRDLSITPTALPACCSGTARERLL